jgi:colicin import membrane protein
MAEQKESSVLFSLKELMSLEEDRIKKEEDDRKKREEAELQARMEAERRQREEEERRLRADEERKRAEEQRAREEAARLEAIRQAEIEKARVEAENQARMEALRRQQEHEKELEHVRQSSGKKRLTYIAVGASFILVAALVGGGIFVKGKIDEANALKAQLTALNSEKDETERKLREAKTDEEKAALQAKLDDLQNQIDKANKNPTAATTTKPTVKVTGPAVPTVTTPKKPQCHMLDGTKVASCAPGDSLCTCD